MFSKRAAISVAISAAVMVGLAGCALVEPAGTDKPLTAIQSCAMDSSWKLDVAGLAEAVKADLASQGVAVTGASAEGTQTLRWERSGSVVMDSDYTLTITTTPAADQTLIVTSVHKGTSKGVAFINAEVAIPRQWDGTGLSVTSTATVNGAAVDPVPLTLPKTDLDDSVGIELTCDGDTLTTHPRGSVITQKWTRG